MLTERFQALPKQASLADVSTEIHTAPETHFCLNPHATYYSENLKMYLRSQP